LSVARNPLWREGMLDSRHRGCYSPFMFNLQSLQLAREMNTTGGRAKCRMNINSI
jgi:hypothetical protein